MRPDYYVYTTPVRAVVSQPMCTILVRWFILIRSDNLVFAL